jgi:hypothetical protein
MAEQGMAGGQREPLVLLDKGGLADHSASIQQQGG